jgi:hypothetical protein
MEELVAMTPWASQTNYDGGKAQKMPHKNIKGREIQG